MSKTVEPNFKNKVVELLQTNLQNHQYLITTEADNKCSYCIEGIFALALEGSPVQSKYVASSGFTIPGYRDQYGFLDDTILKDRVPFRLKISYLLKLKNELSLTDLQVEELKAYGQETGEERINWRTLNDKIKITFKQFSELLHLL
jgi:hypothetical protein